MENNILSPALFIMQSSTEKESEFFDESKIVCVVGVPLVRLIKLIGFRRALSSKIVRWRYILRLWILREIYIIKVLLENYEKIPKGTPSYLFVGFVKVCKPLNGLMLYVEKILLKKLIRSPYEPKRMDNKKKYNSKSNSNQE